MNAQEIKETIFAAVFRIVRTSKQPTLEEFLKCSINDTVQDNQNSNPTGWPDFWWESLHAEIQNAFIARKKYILNFDKDWLRNNKDNNWMKLYDHLEEEGNLTGL